ncbi:MAG: hypothetical protein Q9219_004784 [cf. Caloplaca sp. 3 TL-2023]
MSTPRWQLQLQATTWRNLTKVGFWFHSLAYPRPPSYSFVRTFTTGTHRTSGLNEPISLYFYLPDNFDAKRRQHPVVANFHGGGFTLGSATDDRRWASTVLKDTTAIFVSVEYRLAPEYPFPIAVEDGVEAILYLAAHCQEFGIDPQRIALSGFSAGGNMVFTVPLRLHDYLEQAYTNKSDLPPFKIISIIAFYPLLDFTKPRDTKRAACKRPEKTLPPVLTNLFDAAYLPNQSCQSSPFASPAGAPDEMIGEALPSANIGLHSCEWDMLHAEGLAFALRLEQLGKKVEYESIPEVCHGFDKAPNPMGTHPKADHFYRKACVILQRAMEVEPRKGSTTA